MPPLCYGSPPPLSHRYFSSHCLVYRLRTRLARSAAFRRPPTPPLDASTPLSICRLAHCLIPRPISTARTACPGTYASRISLFS
ncbi:hypothetical protein FA95DRAFT_1561891 [Auriscalpium vulgare]|uniref:Uncharacterized protein n=1 Tax=Auriscalpium vulgare TaxID=40419 RepID=A0ACB8RLG5_9AGAM|nr:hypothetical protein FA95DRAFT_1561891 [Auriscalpium vulgare]